MSTIHRYTVEVEPLEESGHNGDGTPCYRILARATAYVRGQDPAIAARRAVKRIYGPRAVVRLDSPLYARGLRYAGDACYTSYGSLDGPVSRVWVEARQGHPRRAAYDHRG